MYPSTKRHKKKNYIKGVNRPSAKRQRQGERQNLGMGLGRFGAASGAANAFQWDQFDAPDDAAVAARCVHSLTVNV